MALARIPSRNMIAMHEAMNRAFTNSLDTAGGSRAARLPVDVYSTDNEIVVSAALAGVSPEDVQITFENETLTIRGEITPRYEDTNYILAERFHGPFVRKLQVNVPVDVENIEATFENGVLILSLPKAEEARPKLIEIKVK